MEILLPKKILFFKILLSEIIKPYKFPIAQQIQESQL